MARKRLTQLFPFLTPIRVWQRNFFWNLSKHFDSNHYAKRKGNNLPYEVCSSKTVMINENSGQDIIYQKNKVDNLKIISKTVDGIYIEPGQIFSFCYTIRKSRKYGKLKKGLILIDGKIVARKGGGICHLSNLLYYLFLMSPLTIIERHSHAEKSFPNPDANSLDGIDATVSSGWLDLQVRNDTNQTFQIQIDFDTTYMYGKILTNVEPFLTYTIQNENPYYFKKNGETFESVEVVRMTYNQKTGITSYEKLYEEEIAIHYPLPEKIKIESR